MDLGAAGGLLISKQEMEAFPGQSDAHNLAYR